MMKEDLTKSPIQFRVAQRKCIFNHDVTEPASYVTAQGREVKTVRQYLISVKKTEQLMELSEQQHYSILCP